MNNRIRTLRKELNLTLDKFGEQIGLKKSSLSQIENGKCAITEQTIKSICREFNVNENWLRTGEGDIHIQMNEEDELMQWAGKVLSKQSSDFQYRFVKMLMGLTEEQWQVFEDKVRELTSDSDTIKKDK
ncbi:MAG: helix-turn-helix transcriptional regulator [Lachnospiraceae bacterium]|nr:helix-turn-helix transcriptional regulator [Lachnospiraceae bacterium]